MIGFIVRESNIVTIAQLKLLIWILEYFEMITMLGLKACNSTKICTSHGQIFSVVIISFQKKDGWVVQKTCSINFSPSPDKGMGKVGMCVKVLLSQTKIIIPDPVGEVPRDMSPFLCVAFLYLLYFSSHRQR